MVQLAAVDAQNPCQLFRVNLFPYAISRVCDVQIQMTSGDETTNIELGLHFNIVQLILIFCWLTLNHFKSSS